VHIENPGIDEIDDHIDKATNRIAVALVILGGFMGSAIVGVFAAGGPHALGIHVLALVGFVLSGVFGTWLVWGILRHGKL
jgi:ubiquinone biosynthesis protein